MTGSAPPPNDAMSSAWAATASKLGSLGSFMNTAKQVNSPSPASGGKRRRSKKGSKKRSKKAPKKSRRKSRRHRKKSSSSGFNIF